MTPATIASHDIKLPISRFRAVYRVAKPTQLPEYPGSAWRGAFGHALKGALCVTGIPVCADCPMFRSCGYAYIFETPPQADSGKMRKYPAAPHPFVLTFGSPRECVEAGSAYEVGFSLIGRGSQYLPQIIHALQQAGPRVLVTGNTEGGNFVLERVDQCELAGNCRSPIYSPGQPCKPFPVGTPPIPAVPRAAKVVFETPLRFKRGSKIVGAHDFTFAAFFSMLLRRVSMLSYFHTDTPLETDFAGLVHAAKDVQLAETALRWQNLDRYSSRQKRKIPLGGLLGSFLLDGSSIAPFWPYLWLGQYVHAGAASSMGMGSYHIDPAAELPKAAGSNEASTP